jgi:hypothetical protein
MGQRIGHGSTEAEFSILEFVVNNNWVPLPCFSKVLILKVDKVLCFDTLLQVLILKDLEEVA